MTPTLFDDYEARKSGEDPYSRDPDQLARIERAHAVIRASTLAARPEIEIARGYQEPEPVIETLEQVLERVRNAGPVVLGPELAKKLEAMGARFDSGDDMDDPLPDEV